VVNRDGSVDIYQITIYVEPVTDAPYISQFTVDPHPQITVGQCVTIRWKVEGEVDKIKLTANNATLWDGAPKTGKLDDCPPGVGTVDYVIEATGPGGSSRQQRTIIVGDAPTSTPTTPPEATATPTSAPEDTPTPEPTATPAPESPVIYSFDVNPNEIEVNGNINITWSTGGGTTRVVIKRDNDTVYDGPDLSGNYQQTLNQPGQITYRIEAYNDVDDVDSREEIVTVHDAIPDNPLADTNWILEGTIDDTTITASFGADWSLNGSSGCNSYSARYTVNGNNITISGLGGSTQMLCDDDVMAQEQQYLRDLQAASSYQISGSQLTLSSGLVYKGKQPR
jgi:heat shock protein HslJ